jgi:hypothetical protein
LSASFEHCSIPLTCEVGNVARTPSSTKPDRISRAVYQVTVVIVGLLSPLGLRAAELLHVEIDFRPVYSLPVVELATSQGKLRLVVDTASNFTSLLRAPKCLRVRLAGQEIHLHPVPIQTSEFAGFNAALPASDQVDGLLGEDFFRRFEVVRFDFPRHKILLVLQLSRGSGKVKEPQG